MINDKSNDVEEKTLPTNITRNNVNTQIAIKKILFSMSLTVLVYILNFLILPRFLPIMTIIRLDIGISICITLWSGITGILSIFIIYFLLTYILFNNLTFTITITTDLLIRNIIILLAFEKLNLKSDLSDAKSLTGILLFGVFIASLISTLILLAIQTQLSIDILVLTNSILKQVIIDGTMIATTTIPLLTFLTNNVRRTLEVKKVVL
ncbi:MAG: hypothetical protein ACP6IU_08150 [Candidatus Asgardarchaeia archaeon]